jgi:hypothetical protein
LINIDSKNLPEKVVSVLCPIARIVCRSTITHSNMEKSITAEFNHSSIVIREGLVNDQDYPLCSQSHIPICRGHLEFRNHRGTIARARIVDKEASVRRVLRVECQAEQPSLTTARPF